ncbi:MAG: pyrroloquinoline quinone biosynthesis protein PqqD [Devosia sp.]|nr:pyrroloquinoline quinone biosynthesis protein PqqD [Devosia sp.]
MAHLPTETFAIASPEIAAEDFDGEFVVLNMETGKYFSVAKAAAVVWRGLVAGLSLETLAAALPADAARYAEIATLVEFLVTNGLLIASDAPPVTDAGIAADLAAAEPQFTVEVFDDLADLFIADPIHDVEATAGWPHRPGQ